MHLLLKVCIQVSISSFVQRFLKYLSIMHFFLGGGGKRSPETNIYVAIFVVVSIFKYTKYFTKIIFYWWFCFHVAIKMIYYSYSLHNLLESLSSLFDPCYIIILTFVVWVFLVVKILNFSWFFLFTTGYVCIWIKVDCEYLRCLLF